MTPDQVEDRLDMPLFDYQREYLEGLPGLPEPTRTCLYYRTGAGKSVTALAGLLVQGYDTCVIVSPPSTHVQWSALADRMGIDARVMSHARYRMQGTKLSRTVPLVADEMHMFGGRNGQGWRKLDKLATALQAPLVLASATPNYNDAERVYCIQHVLDPGSCRGGYLQFLYEHCTTEQNKYGMEPIVTGFRAYPDAAGYLSDLPGVFYVADELEVVMEDVLYDPALPQPLLIYGYLAQLHRIIASVIEWRHSTRVVGLTGGGHGIREEVMEKVRPVLESRPVLVFSHHATVAAAFSRALAAEGVEHSVVVGSTPKAQKERALREFLAGDVGVLVGTASLATGTDGMDRVCDTLLILDDTDDDALRRQLIGRIMPRGASGSVADKRVVRLVPSS
jgi:hypothetical protein